MACSNCYNGCSEITSDKCVKYTGIDIPILGIKNGDSLSYIEQAIIGFLVSTLDGTGIKPNMDTFNFCTLISDNLPTCGDVTILDIEQALGTAICTLQDMIAQLTSTVDTINTGYLVGCLASESINDGSAIHEILQALIDRFCTVEANLTALSLDVSTNYVKLADLNQLIQDYLDTLAPGDMISNKMIPYVAVPCFDPNLLDNFNASGAGLGLWDRIFLCNGDNGTPDLRGRTVVGLTDMLGAAPLDTEVVSPVYTLSQRRGDNSIVLSIAEMPTHTHVATVTDPEHFHYEFSAGAGTAAETTALTYSSVAHVWAVGDQHYEIEGNASQATLGKTSSEETGVTVSNATEGSSNSHSNIQPSIGCYFIIYIP